MHGDGGVEWAWRENTRLPCFPPSEHPRSSSSGEILFLSNPAVGSTAPSLPHCLPHTPSNPPAGYAVPSLLPFTPSPTPSNPPAGQVTMAEHRVSCSVCLSCTTKLTSCCSCRCRRPAPSPDGLHPLSSLSPAPSPCPHPQAGLPSDCTASLPTPSGPRGGMGKGAPPPPAAGRGGVLAAGSRRDCTKLCDSRRASSTLLQPPSPLHSYVTYAGRHGRRY